MKPATTIIDRGRAHLVEQLLVGAADVVDVPGVGEVHPGADHGSAPRPSSSSASTRRAKA